MKRKSIILFAIIFCSIISQNTHAQRKYFTSQDQYLISVSNIDNDIPRVSIFPNYEMVYNYDFNKFLGIYTGISFKNIGLIYENGQKKYKIRSLTASTPVSIKLGNLKEETFFSLGGEYEFLYHTKEKEFSGDTKTKQSEFLSDRTPLFLPSIIAGICYKRVYVRVKYYLKDYLNKDYSYTMNGTQMQPYKSLTSRIIYLSISYRAGFLNDSKPTKEKDTKYQASL